MQHRFEGESDPVDLWNRNDRYRNRAGGGVGATIQRRSSMDGRGDGICERRLRGI